MMKTICIVFIVGFTMENFCSSAQQRTATACKDGTLLLNCLTGLIQVDNIVLADSGCLGSRCCPRQKDCHGTPSATYRNQVYAACNGQSSCSMNVEIRNIGCGFWSPSNDYTNITYSCIATSTSPASTILTITSSPSTLSSSSASTRQHSTTSTSTSINTLPYTADDKRATEIEKKDGDTTTSQSSVEGSTQLNPTPAQKTGVDTSGSQQEKSGSHVQTNQEDEGYGYLDRINTMVAVIVGGVVIIAIVISVAVVLALKKRRTAKSEEHYDMPNVNQSCDANNENEINVRNSNLYDFIPDPGDCSNYTGLKCTTAKESDYLTPVGLIEGKEAPYMMII